MLLPSSWPSRRRLLKGGAGAGATFIAAPYLLRHAVAQAWHAGDPFSLGVAAGAPRPDGFVLWTRLAPDPLCNNPATPGGMHGSDVTVGYEIATDSSLRNIVRRGEAIAGDFCVFGSSRCRRFGCGPVLLVPLHEWRCVEPHWTSSDAAEAE